MALALQAQLCEDAAQLPPSQHDVVGPLDPGPHTAGRLDAVAHRHRHPGSEVHHLLGREGGPQQCGEVQPRATGRLEGAAQTPPAAGLLFTEDDQPIGGPGHGLALGLRIGGVDDIQAYQPASHMAARQRSGQFPLPDPVRGTLQPIAPLGGGLDLIPLLPQGLNGPSTPPPG